MTFSSDLIISKIDKKKFAKNHLKHTKLQQRKENFISQKQTVETTLESQFKIPLRVSKRAFIRHILS